MKLERFRAAKQAELDVLRKLEKEGGLPAPLTEKRPDFLTALRYRQPHVPLAIIAEYKRASPSRGSICEHLSVQDVAMQYARAGASALSILTEQQYFHGDISFLAQAAFSLGGASQKKEAAYTLPLLRKDFIFDPLQVMATAATPAAALLLIVRLTPDVRELRLLRELAEQAGMQAVVEVFDAADLRLARESGARIIQVNARDLETLAVDRNACLQLARECPPEGEECWIAASGISSAQHIHAAADAGYHAALVGTALMEQGEPGKALLGLLSEASQIRLS